MLVVGAVVGVLRGRQLRSASRAVGTTVQPDDDCAARELLLARATS